MPPVNLTAAEWLELRLLSRSAWAEGPGGTRVFFGTPERLQLLHRLLEALGAPPIPAQGAQWPK